MTQASSARGVKSAASGILSVTLVATILGSSLSFIDGAAVNVALPSLQRDFGATVAEVQWVIEAYSLFLSALILVGGSFGDRFGRRRIYVIGILVFTVASIACGLAPNIIFLIGARAIQGIGGALLVPGSLALITAVYDKTRRGAAIGAWAGFTTVSSALGPVLGGWLTQTASWRWVFFINVPLAAITLALVFMGVPESRDESETGPLDWPGVVLATLGLGLVVFGLIEGSAIGLGAPLVVGALIAGVLALLSFVAVERRSPTPMMPLSLFRSRTFSGANLLTLLLYGALGGTLYFLPFMLQQVQGYSAAEAGASLLPFTIIIFALSRWTGGLTQRTGARAPLIVGPLVAALGFALFAVPGLGGSYWTTYFPAVVALSVGMALVIAPLTTTVMNSAPVERSGAASGINNAVSRASGLIAIAVMNLIVVAVFASAFDMGLAALHLSPSLEQAMRAQSQLLAAASPPPGTPPGVAAAIHHVTDLSFLNGFRVAMLLGAALAVGSAGMAALLIEGPGLRKAARRLFSKRIADDDTADEHAGNEHAADVGVANTGSSAPPSARPS